MVVLGGVLVTSEVECVIRRLVRPKLSPPMYSMMVFSFECSSGTFTPLIPSVSVLVEGGSSRRDTSEYIIGMSRVLFSFSRTSATETIP